MSVTSIVRRFDGRRALARLRGWPAVALSIAVLLGMGAVAVNSPIFHARTIEVSGISRPSELSRRAVVEVAGVSRETNVLWLDTGVAERRLQANPWIAEATVSRELPATVRIDIRERMPVATVRGTGEFVVVAGDGRILERVEQDPRLPLVWGASVDGGEWLAPRGAARALDAMLESVRSNVRRVVVGEDGSLTLRLRSGAQVLYGDERLPAEKASALQGVLEWAAREGRRLATVDVRAPSSPAVRAG